MNRISQTDNLYALIIDDNDQDYTQIDTSNDNVIMSGNWTTRSRDLLAISSIFRTPD